MSGLWVLPEELGDYSTSEYAYEAAKSASFLLWGLSGRKFTGTTTATETYEYPRPNIDPSLIFDEPTEAGLTYKYVTQPYVPNTYYRLRGRPVQSIALVTNLADNTTISPDDYDVINHAVLQFHYILNADVEVTYSYGNPPPTMGKMAARQLAIEFAMLWSGDEDCSLPQRVTSVTRQGISYTLLDAQDFIADLRTGVYAVDLFLKTTNPDRAVQRARVFSPDIPRGKRKSTS
jgi:hypothetical protein